MEGADDQGRAPGIRAGAAAAGDIRSRRPAIVAIKNAAAHGPPWARRIKHLVLCQVEKRPPKLDLDVYPYLPRANVAKTSAASYLCLVSGMRHDRSPQAPAAHHLKTLKLPTFLREYDKLAPPVARLRLDHVQFLARLVGAVTDRS